MRGQIFTLDALLSVLIATAIIGLVTMQLGMIYNHSSDINYFEKQALADDWSQIAVKNILLANDYSPNIDSAKIPLLSSNMSNAIGTKFSYAIISTAGSSINPNVCDGKNNTAVSKRNVIFISGLGTITVKICDA